VRTCFLFGETLRCFFAPIPRMDLESALEGGRIKAAQGKTIGTTREVRSLGQPKRFLKSDQRLFSKADVPQIA